LLPLSPSEVKFFTKEFENQVKDTQIAEKYLGSKYNRLTFAIRLKKRVWLEGRKFFESWEAIAL